jgi:hypothetical protein
MSSNLPDFEKAEYLAPSTTPTYSQQPIVSGDVDARGWEAQASDHARFTKAITYGIGAAILGSILYAAFTIVTHIQIGYVAIGVGYLVGKAMLAATGGHSSRKYQIAAAVLTYLSVSLASIPEILWALHSEGKDISHISGRGILFLARYGVASPFLDIQDEGLSALIGLFILFIGIRAAWRLTADRGGRAGM